MKWNLAALVLTGLQLQAAPDPAKPILTGIVNLPDMKVALVTLGPEELMLAEGQTDKDIEVRQVRPGEAKVEVSIRGAITNDIWLALPLTSTTIPSIALQDASLSSLLLLYAQCAGHSLLQHPSLPRDIKFTLSVQVATRENARQSFESALEEKSLATIPDGNFIMVVPKAAVSQVKPHAPKPNPLGKDAEEQSTRSHVTSENEIIPAGMIDLRGAVEPQVLMLYADLLGKRLDRGPQLPWSGEDKIYFTSRTPLTREEVGYALETILAWRGIKMVPAAEGFVKAVRATEQER